MSANFLVTGFEPFGEHRTNSSWDALEHLRPSWPDGIVTRRLPVDHRAAHEALRHALAKLEPSAVLCTGLAQGLVFRIERQARRPSQFGSEREPELALGRWPWQEMRRALERCGAPAIESFDAGRYVCESTYWSLLTHGDQGSRPPFAAFLHVPPASDEYPLAWIAAAVAAVVETRREGL